MQRGRLTDKRNHKGLITNWLKEMFKERKITHWSGVILPLAQYSEMYIKGYAPWVVKTSIMLYKVM